MIFELLIIIMIIFYSRADQIVSVNGNSLLDISVDEAMFLISPNELIDLTVTIQVIRPKKVDALNQLLSYNTNDQYNSNWLVINNNNHNYYYYYYYY